MITIIIENDKENLVKVEQEEQTSKTKPKTKGKPVFVYEIELANYLLAKGYIMRKILPNNKTNEGFVFSFHNTGNIRKTMKKWNRERNQKVDEFLKEIEDLPITEDDTTKNMEVHEQ